MEDRWFRRMIKILLASKLITSFEQVKFNGVTSRIHTIGAEVENAYYDEVKS